MLAHRSCLGNLAKVLANANTNGKLPCTSSQNSAKTPWTLVGDEGHRTICSLRHRTCPGHAYSSVLFRMLFSDVLIGESPSGEDG